MLGNISGIYSIFDAYTIIISNNKYEQVCKDKY